MTPSSPNPKLPLWIFFLADAILVLTAWFVAYGSARPLSALAIYSIVACTIAGAIILTIPLVLYYEREKNEALDDRQRALEALASTVATSAEQISIAAQGLHAIAELAQKNLQLAEQLPARLQEKITGFETLLANAQADEREELKQELTRLRAADGERLEAIARKVGDSAAELARLEAAAHQHLAAAQAALAEAPAALTTATAAALARIESKLASHTTAATPPRATKAAESSGEPGVQIQPVVPPTAAPFVDNLISATPAEPPAESPSPEPAAESSSPEEAKPAKKRAPRKPRPAEPAEATPAPGLDEPPTTLPAGKAPTEPDEAGQDGADDALKPVAGVVENVISSDRATRLLVTAYIGIGNRLFIRGDGPGLSWDKGVPLQFVSIGKWRWETNDATAAVSYKLYKNDESECTALGRQRLQPEHQQEITATF